MDFSNKAFQAPKNPWTNSVEGTAHTTSLLDCQFSWTAGPHSGSSMPSTSHRTQVPTFQANKSHTPSNTQRFKNCRGRLYHQLTCSHRIRTDIVEPCGPNCLDPNPSCQTTSNLPFYCHVCIENQASDVWSAQRTQYYQQYPSPDQMTGPQFDQWYEGLRQLELRFQQDRQAHELKLRAGSRPSNVTSVLEATEEEMDVTAEIESLCLDIGSANEGNGSGYQPKHRGQHVSLPTDAEEQLHWQLNALALDRGSCSVDYSQSSSTSSQARMMSEEELWKKPRR
jgi:hypothetical protein